MQCNVMEWNGMEWYVCMYVCIVCIVCIVCNVCIVCMRAYIAIAFDSSPCFAYSKCVQWPRFWVVPFLGTNPTQTLPEKKYKHQGVRHIQTQIYVDLYRPYHLFTFVQLVFVKSVENGTSNFGGRGKCRVSRCTPCPAARTSRWERPTSTVINDF